MVEKVLKSLEKNCYNRNNYVFLETFYEFDIMDRTYLLEEIAKIRRIILEKRGSFTTKECETIAVALEVDNVSLIAMLEAVRKDLSPQKFVLNFKDAERFQLLRATLQKNAEHVLLKKIAAELTILAENFKKPQADGDECSKAILKLRTQIKPYAAKVPKLVKYLNEYADLCETNFLNVIKLKVLRINLRFLPLLKEAEGLFAACEDTSDKELYWAMAEQLYLNNPSLFKEEIYYFSIIRGILDALYRRAGLKLIALDIPEKIVLIEEQRPVEVEAFEENSNDQSVIAVAEAETEESNEELNAIEEPQIELVKESEPIETSVEVEEIQAESETVELDSESVEEEPESIVTVPEEPSPEDKVVESEPEIVEYNSEELEIESGTAEIEQESVETESVTVDAEAQITESESKNVESESEQLEPKLVEPEIINQEQSEVVHPELVHPEPDIKCAESIIESAAPQSEQSIPFTPKKSRKVLYVIVGCVLLVLMAVGIFFATRTQPVKPSAIPPIATDSIIVVKDTTKALPANVPEAIPVPKAVEQTKKTKVTPKTLPQPKPQAEKPQTVDQPESEPAKVEKKAQPNSLDAAREATQNGDFKKAFDIYRSLANAGNSEAQYCLGIMYETGKGVDIDIFEAVMWYRKSKAQGFKLAERKLQELGYN